MEEFGDAEGWEVDVGSKTARLAAFRDRLFFVSDEIEMCEYCDFDQIYSMLLPTGIERRKPTMATTKKTVKKSTKNVKTTVSTPGTSKLATSKRGL